VDPDLTHILDEMVLNPIEKRHFRNMFDSETFYFEIYFVILPRHTFISRQRLLSIFLPKRPIFENPSLIFR